MFKISSSNQRKYLFSFSNVPTCYIRYEVKINPIKISILKNYGQFSQCQ